MKRRSKVGSGVSASAWFYAQSFHSLRESVPVADATCKQIIDLRAGTTCSLRRGHEGACACEARS